MNCKNCGAEVKEGFSFCMSCGAKIENADEMINSEENGALENEETVPEAAPDEIPETVPEETPERVCDCGDCNRESAEEKPEKKRRRWPVLISLVSAVALLGALLTASFSPIQVISAQNSPVQDLIDAYLKGELDGYKLEVNTTTTYEGEEPENDTKKFVYGAFDLKTATRAFELEISTDYDGVRQQYYKTPDFEYDNSVPSSSGSYGSLTKLENQRSGDVDLLKAISAKNYRELAAYINRSYFNYPMLDEGGFDRCMRRLNRELKDEEYAEIVFGFEKEESKNGVTYKFEFDYIEVLEWFCCVAEENDKAFLSEAKHQACLKSLKTTLEYLKEEFTKDVCKYEIEIEDGYILSVIEEREYTRKSYYDEGSETVKVTTERKYSDHGDASADSEVLKSFKEYKNELGKGYSVEWDDGEIRVYDKNGNRLDD